jgi:putative transposase
MQNAFAESFIGRLRDELLNETLFRSLPHTRAVLDVWRADYKCSEPAKLDRFWLESSASIPRLGGAESDEGLEVFGRPEGVHFEARG